ncbi:coenzyme Q biosynthesis protein Coq4-domain-containing protein [Mycena haematopus]|nr:coenzyme Q biosynthesis protein Coq4-domain-containing protein [Mycena haematopus]
MSAVLRSRLTRLPGPLNVARIVAHKNVLATRSIGSKVPRMRAHPAETGLKPESLQWALHSCLLLIPRRGDMVAALGETTAGPSLPRLRDIMLESAEGRQILKDRPRINSSTVDMSKLAQLPEGTMGRAYITWLERCGVTPDTREPVHYIDDPELAYVMQRYRECHDLYHCIVNLPVSVEAEIAVKYFEFANLGLPLAALSAIFGPLRLNSTQLQRLFSEYVPWALRCGGSARSLITVYWEQRWDQNIEDIKKELGLWDAPPAKWRNHSAKPSVLRRSVN